MLTIELRIVSITQGHSPISSRHMFFGVSIPYFGFVILGFDLIFSLFPLVFVGPQPLLHAHWVVVDVLCMLFLALAHLVIVGFFYLLGVASSARHLVLDHPSNRVHFDLPHNGKAYLIQNHP